MTAEWMVSAAMAGIANSLVAALCLVLATTILVRLLRVNASTRYAAWWLCLIAIVAVAVFQPVATMSAPAETQHPRAVAGPSARLVVATIEDREQRFASASPAPSDGGSDLEPVAAVFWILGSLFCLTRLARSYRWIRARRAHSTPGDSERLAACLARCPTRRRVALRMSDEIRTPIATGFLRPAILLPSRLAAHLDDDALNDIITHELAHLARRDDWAQLAERLLGAVLWFHPALRWTLRKIRLEREHCCDDRVVLSGARARTYAGSLVKLAEWRRGTHSLALAVAETGGRSEMYRRVEALVRRKGHASVNISSIRLTIAALVLTTVGAAIAPVTDFFIMTPPLRAAEPAPSQAPSPTNVPKTAPPPAASKPPRAPAPPAATIPQSPPVPSARPSGLLGALKAAGYGDLSVEEIIEIKNAGISADFLLDLRDAGAGRIPTRELISLKQHGVSAQYLKEMLSAGGISFRDVVDFRSNGVSASLVVAIQKLKFGPYTTRQIIDFHNNGVRAEFFQMLRDNGIQQMEPRDIVEARVHGLNDSSLREARRYGPNLTFQQIIKLKRAGVI